MKKSKKNPDRVLTEDDIAIISDALIVAIKAYEEKFRRGKGAHRQEAIDIWSAMFDKLNGTVKGVDY